MTPLLLAIGAALAQSPAPAPSPVPVPAPVPVFVAPLQPTDPALQGEALRLTALLEADLGQTRPIWTIRQVPPWPDYDAFVYMMSCPAGAYSGCALVCGQRLQAPFTVGGTVSRGLMGGVAVDLVFIDTRASRELLAFGIALDGSNDADLTQGVSTILGKVTGGAFEAIDLRAVDTDPNERAKLDAAQRKVLADSVAELERQQGQVVRQEVDGPAQVKLSKEDLAAQRARDDAKPWERVGMKEAEYLRYRNSGKDLATWRRLRRGRLGEIVGRVALGGGSGPFGQQMDGRYALDDQLQLAHVEQYQWVDRAPHVHADFELGFGVLPFLDVAGHFAMRNSQFKFLINQEKVGDPVFLDDVQQNAVGSWQAGARASFVPFPARGVRPALHGGIAYWQGRSWQSLIGGVAALTPMEKLNAVVVQVGPGVELAMGRRVNVFARGLVDLSVGGNRQQSVKVGGPALQEPFDPSGVTLPRPGFTLQAGLVGRLAVIGGAEDGRGPQMQFEEEEP